MFPVHCALYTGGNEWCAMCVMGAGGIILCMLLRILEATEGELRLLEVLE